MTGEGTRACTAADIVGVAPWVEAVAMGWILALVALACGGWRRRD